MKLKQGPRVYIDAEAMERIWQWTALARGEFSCLAMVTGDLFVHSAALFDQVCTTSSTELNQDALAKFLCRHGQPEAVRAWIHSHGNLGVFWSDQDEACISGLANESFLVSIVVNKKHEIRCRIDVFQPMRLTIDEVELEVRAPSHELAAECERLFNAHVTEPVVTQRVTWQAAQPTTPPTTPASAPNNLINVYSGWPDFDDDYCDWR